MFETVVLQNEPESFTWKYLRQLTHKGHCELIHGRHMEGLKGFVGELAR